ncbi:MAG: hypothetical protein EHM72_20530, partial [Calditrichaeota bacterium]
MKYCLGFLFLLLFLAVEIFAQTDPKFDAYLAAERANLPVQGEVLYNGGNIGGYRFGGGSGAVKKVVDADPSMPFGKVLQLKTNQVGANSWEPQFQSPTNAIPLTQGDILFYIFYMRVIQSSNPNGDGTGIFYVQQSSSPWTGLGSSSLTFKSAWRKMYIVAHAGQDYPKNTMEFTIHLGSQAQTVEVGGIIALNLGQGIDEAELPRNPLYWDGMESDAAWRAEADARIEQHRKGDLTVVVKNQQGEWVRNGLVKVNMKK